METNHRWTDKEDQYIRDHWERMSDAQMAASLNRSEGAVANRRQKLCCSTKRTWTPEEERYLEDHWGTVSIPGIAKKLGRTVHAVKVRAVRMGLGGMLGSGDYVTFNQLMIALTDNAKSYSYQMESWVRRRGFPIHTNVLINAYGGWFTWMSSGSGRSSTGASLTSPSWSRWLWARSRNGCRSSAKRIFRRLPCKGKILGRRTRTAD